MVHDVNILDMLIPEAGAFYVMDRGYLDFARLYSLHLNNSFFVTRAKSNFKFNRIYSHNVNRATGVICDQTINLSWFLSHQKITLIILGELNIMINIQINILSFLQIIFG